MALYIGDKKYAVTKALYRGFYMVVVHGFAGTTVTCAGTTLYIGSNESVIFKIVEPGTYTFVANRKGETKTETLVLDPETSQYSYNIGMYLGMQLVEYLEADTTQYIDTGIVPHPGYSVEMEFQFTSITPDDPEVSPSTQICGVRQTDNPDRFYPIAVRDDVLRSSYGNTEISYNASENLLKHKVEFNKNGHIYLDGVDKGATSGYVEPSDPQYTMFLFKWNYGPSGPSDPVCKMRIFSYKMWDNNGTLVQDLVPVLDNTLQGCFYDRVSQQIYYNAGTGEFITGPSMAFDELVYIESTGTQYIDTGFNPTTNTKINMIYCVTKSGYKAFCGSQPGESSGALLAWADNWYVNQSSGGGYSKSYDLNKIYEDTIYRNIWEHNGETTTVSTPVTANNYSLYIFGRNRSGSLFRPSEMKVYSFKVWDNGVLVRDLIPVKRKNGDICMWDKVEEKFYYNKGTGNFIAGPKLEYTELEYIQSSGTQYIDTETPRLLTNSYQVDTLVRYSDVTTRQLNGVGGYTYFGVVGGYYQISRQGTDHQNITVSSDQISKFNIDFDCPNNKMRYRINGSSEIEENVTYLNVPENGNFWLFDLGTGGGYPSSEKMYYFKLYRNNQLVRDFIPVKRSDDVLGMLDKVNNKFYWNLGTGEFIAGPEKTGDYQELEYVTCDGNQYINTGIKFTGTTSEIDARYKIDTSLSSSFSSLSATQDNSNNARWGSLQYQKNGNYYTYVVGGLPASQGILKTPSGDIDHAIYSTNGVSLTVTYNNDQPSTLSSSSSAWTDQYLYIGCKNTNGTLDEEFFGNIYDYKLKIDNALVLDLIPVRRYSDWKVCLYDKVNEVYYVSEGSKDFIAGPVKSN